MIWEIVLLVVLGGAFVVLKVLHSENERKRRLERAERDLRMKAATGGFAPQKWDEPEEKNPQGEPQGNGGGEDDRENADPAQDSGEKGAED